MEDHAMNANERITFVATGETRAPKFGEWYLDGQRPVCAAADHAAGRCWPILRRLSPERVAAEARCVEACREASQRFECNRSVGPTMSFIMAGDALRAVIASEEPRPRYEVAKNSFKDDCWCVGWRNPSCEWVNVANFYDSDAEQDAREHAARLNARASGGGDRP
jgi:hypothetical protein